MIFEFAQWVKRGPLLDQLKLRGLVNSAFYNPRQVIISYSNFDYLEVDGFRFGCSDQIDSVQRVKGNPWFDNMRLTDIGVDIGANIGAITIPLATYTSKVIAMEPLFWRELQKNAQANNLGNIIIEPYCLGPRTGDKIQITFSSRSEMVTTYTWRDFRRYIGDKIDWLKLDCEGAEWLINPEDLEGIREIRAELHFRRKHRYHDQAKYVKWIRWLERNDYEYKVEYGLQPGFMVPFSNVVLLNASKREDPEDGVIMAGPSTSNSGLCIRPITSILDKE